MERTIRISAADRENRTAFLVQLRALLLQAQRVVSGGQKGRPRGASCDIDGWVKEVGEAAPPFSDGSFRSDAAEKNGETVNGNHDSQNSKGSSHGGNASTIGQDLASTFVGGPSPNMTRREDESPSPTVDMCSSVGSAMPFGSTNGDNVFSSDFKSRNLEDIAEFLQVFFTSGAQEIVKLRSIGRNGARLVIVRCFSIITCALEQVVCEIYGANVEAVESDVNTEANGSPRSSFFVRCAHDIRISTNAVMKCLELLTVHSDLLSMRFATQVCVDILKQLRQCIFIFTQRLLRWELHRLCIVGDAASGSNLDFQDALKARQMAEERVGELRRTLGPSLLTSVEQLMDLVRPTVQYLISVASLKETSGSTEERNLQNDACANLFGLAQWVTSTVWLKRRKQKALSKDATVSERDDDTPQDWLFSVDMTQLGPLSDTDHLAVMNPSWRRAAHFIVESLLPTAFSPEYISCVAQHCGDQSEGELLAVRLLRDAIKKLAETNITELRYVLGCVRWKRRIAEGILHCLVSVQPVVLEAGLDTLQRIAVECVDCLGSEIGFVYTSCVFGLLESDSTPPAMRRLLLQHVVSTFFRSAGESGQPSLLLRLYQHFDLNVRWHHLNVVQQAVATLSKAVRCAASGDFADEVSSDDDQNVTLVQRSIPFLALQGLSLAVGQLAMHIPQDSCIAERSVVPSMSNRDKKVEEQRAVDIINSSPLKGLRKLFDITDEEMSPGGRGSKAAENNWAHQHIPSPASPETEAKVRRIAQFLMETPSLNPESVAEFLSHPAVLPLQVCQAFMKRLPLAGKNLVEGLKELFSLVQLPKEGQRIERLLEFFCSAYFAINSVEGVDGETFPFESENACFIAGVAVLMLNTNLHNPHVSSVKMTAASFHAQLQGCNEGKGFSERFTRNIFDEINAHSLSSMKGFWSAGMSSGVRYASVPFPGKMDSIFLSSEERRELAFAVVRQRLVSETRELVYRCSRIDTDSRERTPLFWYGVTRDLFLSTWPSLCAVFGVAVHEARVSEETLALCVMGLRSSFLVAAAFGLHTECGVSQMALLRMALFEPMRDVCQKSILDVASSPHSFFFSARCWMPVVNLLITVFKQKQTMIAEAEAVLSRMEEFTRMSCVNDNEKTGNDATNSFKGVVQEMLQGILSVVQDTSIDEATLSAALHVLQRALGYSLILHEKQQQAVVTNFINVRDFDHLVVPALIDVIEARSGKSDECLHLVVDFVVDVLDTMWSSCVYDMGSQRVVSQSEVSECYCFFQRCYERCEASAEVRMHVLQGVKELIARTFHKVVGCAATDPVSPLPHTVHTMALIWRRLLQPVARALSEKGGVGMETCGLAVHVLRKLVVLCCGVGGVPDSTSMQKGVRNILLLLLSNVAYIGGMCSDVDSAQLSLSQLSTICTTALNQNATISCENGLPHILENEEIESNLVETNETPLLRHLILSVRQKSDVLILHSLERMSLLLLSQTQQVRTEVLTVLRTLANDLEPSQLRHLAVHLSNVVLEASLGHATLDYKPSMTDPSYVSYTLFDLHVPPTMSVCSPTSFRATLPDALKFMSHELLVAASAEHLYSIVSIVMKLCMVPLSVSPRSSFQMRTAAVRSLMQCASLCVTRHTVGDDALCPRLVAECVSLVLLALRVPVSLIVPDTADYAGRRWVTEKRSETLRLYMQKGSDVIEALCAAEAHQVTGSLRSSTCQPAKEGHVQVEPTEEFDGTMRSNRSLPHGDVVTDEQLVEYCSLMAQLLSPLPKVLGAVPPHARTVAEETEEEEEGALRSHECASWTPPPADQRVLAELLLEATGTFFAILWRVNHVGEMESFVAKSTQQGRDAPPMRKSNALFPHAAVRGGLNAFLELALWMDIPNLRGIITEILRVTAALQTSTVGAREAQKVAEGAVEGAGVQRLSPQEQQHIRSCNVGMYQELSSVIAHWVRTIVQQTDIATSVLSSTEQRELQHVARDPEVFAGLAQLLTVTAGAVILAIREYLTWYVSISHDSDRSLENIEPNFCAPPQPKENGNSKGKQ